MSCSMAMPERVSGSVIGVCLQGFRGSSNTPQPKECLEFSLDAPSNRAAPGSSIGKEIDYDLPGGVIKVVIMDGVKVPHCVQVRDRAEVNLFPIGSDFAGYFMNGSRHVILPLPSPLVMDNSKSHARKKPEVASQVDGSYYTIVIFTLSGRVIFTCRLARSRVLEWHGGCMVWGETREVSKGD